MKASEFNKLSKEEKLKVPFKDKPTINKVAVGCAIPSIVFFILVVILGTCDDMGTNDGDKIQRIDTSSVQIDAIFNSKEVVKKLLKSPSSAEFPMGEQLCWLLPDSTIIVKGAVDSENSFGAMIRSAYFVKYKWVDNIEKLENWTIVDYYLE